MLLWDDVSLHNIVGGTLCLEVTLMACIRLAEGYDPVDLIGACGMGERNERGKHVDAICFGTRLTNSQSADAHVPNS